MKKTVPINYAFIFSRSLGGLDFEKLRMGTARVGDSNEATAENG